VTATLAHNPELETAAQPTLLAWAGWQVQMPADWYPLKLMGSADKGWIMVGDAMCAMFSIHWEKPRGGHVSDGDAWVHKRLTRQGLVANDAPPAAEHFTSCAWAHNVQTEQDKQTTFWYAYSKPADLVLGFKVNGVLPEETLEQLIDHVLPSIRVSAQDSETTWALHDLSLVSPPGFELAQKHLFTGDVAIELKKGLRETLLLRQVYPGSLALERRPHERWIARYPFKEHRKMRNKGRTFEDYAHPHHAGLVGRRRRGMKKLGFPLGFLRPRHTDAVSAYDERFNRVLIAEHMSASETDGRVVEQAIGRMNGYFRDGGPR